jgi:hypothetical protein|tara:strand:+ start:1686 stop:1994 length:309 start_codon:yes stop_codon:yes gene_type:complete
VDLLYFILSSFGITQILVYGSIFNRVRPSKEIANGFFHCPMCIGFWVGVFLFGINGNTELFTYDFSIVNGLLLGGLSSGTSYVLNIIFGDSGIRYEHHRKES